MDSSGTSYLICTEMVKLKASSRTVTPGHWPQQQKTRTVSSRLIFWNTYPWRSRMTGREMSMQNTMSRR